MHHQRPTFLGHVLPLTVIIMGLGSLSNRNSGIHTGGWLPVGRLMGFPLASLPFMATGYHRLLLMSNTLSWITMGSSRMSLGLTAPPGGGYGRPCSSGPLL
jgi:hypothetical protein